MCDTVHNMPLLHIHPYYAIDTKASPMLFNVYSEEIIEKVMENGTVETNFDHPQRLVDKILNAREKFGLLLNMKKTF